MIDPSDKNEEKGEGEGRRKHCKELGNHWDERTTWLYRLTSSEGSLCSLSPNCCWGRGLG